MARIGACQAGCDLPLHSFDLTILEDKLHQHSKAIKHVPHLWSIEAWTIPHNGAMQPIWDLPGQRQCKCLVLQAP